MNNTYTLEDIANFIADYKESQGTEPKNWMLSVPIVGRKMYQKAAFESLKTDVFEQAYNKAKKGSIKEQESFINQMTPILNDFYSKKEAKRR